MQLDKGQTESEGKNLEHWKEEQFFILAIWRFGACAHLWDGIFFLWSVSCAFLWIWGSVYPSQMDLLIDRGEYFCRRSISGGDALFYLLYAYVVWH